MAKVLIADDEPVLIRRMHRLIPWEKLGLTLAGTAEDGEELLEKIRAERPDIVLADICMPCMTGLEVIAKVQAMGYHPHFIITSAYTTFDYARTALKLGVDEFLPKPLTGGVLEKALAETLRKIAAERNAPPAGNQFIEAACEYIEEHYGEPLQLKDAADHVYLSPTYFSALFREEAGIGFSDYLTRVRIRHVKELLQDLGLSLEDIAARCGYSSSKYMGRVFKAETGTTPGEWRLGRKERGDKS